jgi:plastocyanin
MLSYILMKANLYYAGLLAAVLLVLLSTGPSSFATITESTQPSATTDQSDEFDEGTFVAIGKGSNETIQNYTFTPQTVEINAGDSVTWHSPSEISDIHTVSFRGDPSILPPIILPFAVPGGATDFELVPPFDQGEPVIIPSPDGREAIVALNKQTWYPAVIGVNNQTTYLNGTDIQVTLNSTLKWVNSGVIVPAMPSTGGAQPNSTESGATGGEQTIGPPFPPVSSFTVTFQEPGTYPYYCTIHPWMTGQVIVQAQNQTGTLGQNQTGTLGQNQTGTLGQNQTGTLGQNQTGTLGQNLAGAPNPIFE